MKGTDKIKTSHLHIFVCLFSLFTLLTTLLCFFLP